ncbi:CE1 family esterase [Microbacterium shaanxiense]
MTDQSRQFIDVDGTRRSYIHVAPASPRPDAPLLLALHGSSQQGRTMQRFSGRTLDALAQRIGADLVYLNGYGRAWNDARRQKLSKAQKADIDDVGFVSAVIDRLARPTIAVGYSNGGQLTHRILRERPALLAGATIIAAGLPVDDDYLLADVDPGRVPVLIVHGTADPIVPYAGGMPRMLGRATRGMVQSAPATARRYAPAGEPRIRRDSDLERADWDGVRFITQVGTGHVIPNRTTSPLPIAVGPSHHDIDLGEEIESYFGLSPL